MTIPPPHDAQPLPPIVDKVESRAVDSRDVDPHDDELLGQLSDQLEQLQHLSTADQLEQFSAIHAQLQQLLATGVSSTSPQH